MATPGRVANDQSRQASEREKGNWRGTQEADLVQVARRLSHRRLTEDGPSEQGDGYEDDELD